MDTSDDFFELSDHGSLSAAAVCSAGPWLATRRDCGSDDHAYASAFPAVCRGLCCCNRLVCSTVVWRGAVAIGCLSAFTDAAELECVLFGGCNFADPGRTCG